MWAAARRRRAAGRPATGTSWLLWNVNEELILHHLDDAPNDIVVRSRDQKWPFEKTLRGFCEVLYFCDDEELRRSKPMVIAIKDVDVEPRNWSRYLKNSHTATPIKPQGALTLTQRASVTFGYSEPLREVVRLFEDRSAGKNDFGSPYYNIYNYNGIFYYHRGSPVPGGLNLAPRMTRSLVMTKMQSMTKSNSLATTFHRLTVLGRGVTGCCVENFLTQAHNKSEYTLDVDTPNASSFQYLEMRVNAQMQDYVTKEVRPALAMIMHRTVDGKKKQASSSDGEADDEEILDATVETISEVVEDSTVTGDVLECRLAKDFEEGDRMESLTDGVVGRVRFVGKGAAKKSSIKLEIAEGKLSRAIYRPSELRKPKFNPACLIVYPAPAKALDGSRAKVWWNLSAEDTRAVGKDRKGEWYDATLKVKLGAAEGWFVLDYDDDDEVVDDVEQENIFIGMRLDSSWLAHRDDGEELKPDVDLKLEQSALNATYDALPIRTAVTQPALAGSSSSAGGTAAGPPSSSADASSAAPPTETPPVAPPPPKLPSVPKEAAPKWLLTLEWAPGMVTEDDILSFTAWDKPLTMRLQKDMVALGRLDFPVTMPRAADKRQAFISKLKLHGLAINGSTPVLGEGGLRIAFGPPPKDKAPEVSLPKQTASNTQSAEFVAKLRSRIAELEAQAKAQAEQAKDQADAHEIERAQWANQAKAKAEAHKLERSRWEEQLKNLSVETESAQEKLSNETKLQKGLADKLKQMRNLHKAVSEANTELNEQLTAANKRVQVLERQSRAVLARGEDVELEGQTDLGGGAKRQRL